MAYTFTNSGAFVVTGGSLINNLKPLSVSAWVFISSAGGAESPGNAGRIFTKAGPESALTGGPTLFLNTTPNASGSLEFQFFSTITTLDVQTTQGALAVQKWQHIAVTWDGGSTATNTKLYLAGTEPAIYATRQNATGVLDDDSPNNLFIGNRVTFARALTGALCELAFWNAVLTPSEVLLLANSKESRIPLQIQPTKLVGYFPMDETSDNVNTTLNSNTIFDMTSNRLIGIASNGTSGSTPKGFSQSAVSYI